ncbi:MAG: 50S ribosomal protein L11 methyltransferase [Pseudomonadota bacterium]
MEEQSYFYLEIQNLESSLEEILTLELFENGAAGVQENLQFQQMDRKYEPEVIPSSHIDLKAYFIEAPSPDWLQDLQLRYPEVRLRVEESEIRDWLEEWKKQWEPFEVIPGFWIVPSWREAEAKSLEGSCLFIEPGMAFGTGTHETTKIASELIKSVLDSNDIQSCTDVGTGSGILTFLARQLGVSQCIAYDNDEESKRVFFENAHKNQCEDVEWREEWWSESGAKVDLVIANIIDSVLVSLKKEFQKVESPYFIMTGILKEREDSFLKEFLEGWPLEVIRRVEKDEWVGFLFRQTVGEP